MMFSHRVTPEVYKAGGEGRDSVAADTPAAAGRETPFAPTAETSEMVAMGFLVDAGAPVIDRQAPASDETSVLTRIGKRRPGRPRGRTVTKVSISLEDELLQRLDQIAQDRALTRSGVIGDLMRDALASTPPDDH